MFQVLFLVLFLWYGAATIREHVREGDTLSFRILAILTLVLGGATLVAHFLRS